LQHCQRERQSLSLSSSSSHIITNTTAHLRTAARREVGTGSRTSVVCFPFGQRQPSVYVRTPNSCCLFGRPCVWPFELTQFGLSFCVRTADFFPRSLCHILGEARCKVRARGIRTEISACGCRMRPSFLPQLRYGLEHKTEQSDSVMFTIEKLGAYQARKQEALHHPFRARVQGCVEGGVNGASQQARCNEAYDKTPDRRTCLYGWTGLNSLLTTAHSCMSKLATDCSLANRRICARA
jgi:hypothetical protein